MRPGGSAPRVRRKEVLAGLFSGVSIAITCGAAVYVWSRSPGLVAVITTTRILAMVTAGFAGALLTKLGQDPATSSSTVLTTVTDAAGFFSGNRDVAHAVPAMT